ncbi:hypothetical protein AAG906_007386 [Vitis piasezkii]
MLNYNHARTQLRRSSRFSSSSSPTNAQNACVAASPSAASSPSCQKKDQSLTLNCRACGEEEIFLNVEDMSSGRSPVNATPQRELLRNFKTKSLPVSLHENGNGEPVPLKTYDPNFSGGKHLRRSPRFISTPSATGDGFRKRKVNSGEIKSPELSPSVIENSVSLRATDLKMWDAKRLRRSPRLSSSNSVQLQERFLTSLAEMKSPEHENSVSLQATDLKVGDGKCLRRSPRLSSCNCAQPQKRFLTSSAEMKSPELENSVSLRATDLKVWDGQCLRRSTRLSSSNSFQPQERFLTSLAEMKSPEHENSVSLRATDLKVGDGKCLRRSPRLSSSNSAQPQGRFLTSSAEMKSPELENSVSLSATDLKVWDGKCLRRSPRLSSSNSAQTSSAEMKSPELENSVSLSATDLKVWDGKCLRRSSRLSSSNSAQPQGRFLTSSAEMKSPELENSVSLRATDLKVWDGKFLRRSLRLSSSNSIQPQKRFSTSSAEMKSPEIENSVSLSATDLKMWDGNFVQPQQRFLTSSAETKSHEIENPLSLRASDLMWDDKCLRTSPRLSSFNPLLPQKIFLTSSQSSESGNDAKIVSFKTSDVTVMDEKCLRRSPRLSSSLVGPGSSKPIFSCSESSDSFEKRPCKKIVLPTSENRHGQYKRTSFFIGDPVPDKEAQERWHWRYNLKNKRFKGQGLKLNADDNEEEIVTNVECHYTQAKLDGTIFNLGDCAHIKGEGEQKHVGRILEFFKTTEGEDYFRVQWFYRAEDTVMKEEAASHDKKRIFCSTIMNDNSLDCIISKVNVLELTPRVSLKLDSIPPFDYYYDMKYNVEYSTFHVLLSVKGYDLVSPNCIETPLSVANTTFPEDMDGCKSDKAELALLDLYSGCGGMSTGLCLGAKLSCVNLVTKWALDFDKSACESLKLNHPETQVRNETAEDFLDLLKEWEMLCEQYALNLVERKSQSRSNVLRTSKCDINSPHDIKVATDELEILKLVDICYGDPSETGKRGLKFKVRWKGYGPSEDTWEPIEGLSNCQEGIYDFVRNGLKSKILPRPGDVDVICGGPPCQGISGYNRFRNVDSPLSDERNHQIVIFMDIVKFLKPKYVLMENVVDLLKLDKASLGRYAISRLVHMKYQARLGMIAAGCYGLPQFRLRVFLWGAHPGESLPQFPLPTHDVVAKYWPPSEFECNIVAYDEGQPRELEKAVVLRDAISDLPAVTNYETRDEMLYGKPPETEFQKYIRSTKDAMAGSSSSGITKGYNSILHDHRPYPLNEDNYLRVCQIPRRKGANFRDLSGVIVGTDNVAVRDPTMKPILLPSGHPLVPDCVFSYEQGKSKRPFARLWWDETVPTVLTFPYLRNQAILHPEQDRVLTIRECARLQGFPDYYRFRGTVKERYCQIGNAVAFPVARALGYMLGMAFQNQSGNEALATLPLKFSRSMV